jgi:hypothetical protein
MTDPTFETREALGAWFKAMRSYRSFHFARGNEVNVDDISAQMTRVRAAHAHLLEKNDG